MRLLRIASAIIPLYRGVTERSTRREWDEEWETVGRKRHDRTMPALRIIIRRRDTTPPVYGCDSRAIPGAADLVRASRLNPTRFDSNQIDSAVTDESLSVLSPDWHDARRVLPNRGRYEAPPGREFSPA